MPNSANLWPFVGYTNLKILASPASWMLSLRFKSFQINHHPLRTTTFQYSQSWPTIFLKYTCHHLKESVVMYYNIVQHVRKVKKVWLYVWDFWRHILLFLLTLSLLLLSDCIRQEWRLELGFWIRAVGSWRLLGPRFGWVWIEWDTIRVR